jgi:hypothetical protein
MSKKLKGLVLAAAMATGLGACSYGGIATTADGHAVIARNDTILFGLLRAVYVCNVTPAGLAGCVAGQAP